MIYFLLCAYNEEVNIEYVINSIRQKIKNYKIVVVNDGSTDNTKYVLEKLFSNDMVVINHQKNLGLGFALKTGFEYIIPKLTLQDVVVTLDADNTHPVEVVHHMIQKFQEGCDIVIASRYCLGGEQLGVVWYRKLLSFTAKILLKILFPYQNIKDYTTGYRLYCSKILFQAYNEYKEKFITQKNFVVQLELLLKLLKFNPKIDEVPLKLLYYKKYGKSKLKIVKNILSYLDFIIKFMFFKL
jgi:dolichol-phosphate mannosyltransferase